MIAKGTIVEIFEDPFTRTRKEGNAKVVVHIQELQPGVDQYKVHFIGDDDGLAVTRTIVEPPRCCCYERQDDNINCPIHGRV
jgi:hypothetical protein